MVQQRFRQIYCVSYMKKHSTPYGQKLILKYFIDKSPLLCYGRYTSLLCRRNILKDKDSS